MSIGQKIRAWFGKPTDDEHDRYRSWEHCYGFFQRSKRAGIAAQPDYAALHLGFYLASWGMYRGSTFLLKHAYTVHLGVVEVLAKPSFSPLWEKEFGSEEKNRDLVPIILALIEAVREAYKPFGRPATDTLVTKVILGTLGCLPACDQYFVAGFRRKGFKYSYVNRQFVERVFRFCRDNLADLQKEQAKIKKRNGLSYPLMKVVDMYFNEIGLEH
jgi:hypothetical protein